MNAPSRHFQEGFVPTSLVNSQQFEKFDPQIASAKLDRSYVAARAQNMHMEIEPVQSSNYVNSTGASKKAFGVVNSQSFKRSQKALLAASSSKMMLSQQPQKKSSMPIVQGRFEESEAKSQCSSSTLPNYQNQSYRKGKGSTRTPSNQKN